MVPEIRQASPSGWAVVVICVVLEPASGSAIAKAILGEPSAMHGRQRCLSSSLPCASMMEPQMAGR